MKIEDIERKIKVHMDHISKLQKELEKEQSLIPLFVSPPLNIPKSMENCLGWMCIAEDNEYTVFIDKYDIFALYHQVNETNIIQEFINDNLDANWLKINDYIFNWFFPEEISTKGIYKFTPHEGNTYSVTPLKINKDYTLSEV